MGNLKETPIMSSLSYSIENKKENIEYFAWLTSSGIVASGCFKASLELSVVTVAVGASSGGLDSASSSSSSDLWKTTDKSRNNFTYEYSSNKQLYIRVIFFRYQLEWNGGISGRNG